MGMPKALLPLREQTLAAAHARRLAEVARQVVVVASPRVPASALSLPDGVVLATSTALDPAGSLAVGLAMLARLELALSVGPA